MKANNSWYQWCFNAEEILIVPLIILKEGLNRTRICKQYSICAWSQVFDSKIKQQPIRARTMQGTWEKISKGNYCR